MLTLNAIAVIRKILIQEKAVRAPLSAKEFRARNNELKTEIQELTKAKYIFDNGNNYQVNLSKLLELKDKAIEADNLLFRLRLIFPHLKELYIDNVDKFILVSDLATRIDLPENEIESAVSCLTASQPTIIDGCTKNQDAKIIKFRISENILEFDSANQLIADNQNRQELSKPIESQSTDESQAKAEKLRLNFSAYIDQARIDDLESIKDAVFDLKKLIQLCNELNSNWASENYYSVAFLSRCLIDHIPPIFGMENFSNVANSQQRSLRDQFIHLDMSTKKIADTLIHQQIRKVEVLPVANTVNSSRELDSLLIEVIRALKQA